MNDQTRFDPMSYETEAEAFIRSLNEAENAAAAAMTKAQANIASGVDVEYHQAVERLAKQALHSTIIAHNRLQASAERLRADGKMKPGDITVLFGGK